MKKILSMIIWGMVWMARMVPASAAVPDYNDTLNNYKQDSVTPYTFEISDDAGNTVKVMAVSETAYVNIKFVYIRNIPGENGEKLLKVYFGAELTREAVCDNGWSKVSFKDGDQTYNGYVPTQDLSENSDLISCDEEAEVISDSDVLDFPGKKDGQVIGEVLQQDKVHCTGLVNDVWTRISLSSDSGEDKVGYILNTSLAGNEESVLTDTTESLGGSNDDAGVLHESEGQGVFADAVEQVTETTGEGTFSVNGVQIGSPQSASSDAALTSLGTFRITHYCPCSICCGPYTDGITSTGVTAMTNHTIAVDPTQIPYGSKVVINGQVYVAEDCGGAITTNCIDIYVATHEEGESKGVYYTEVYLLNE